MDKERRDDLLARLQVEAQHRQRIDSLWTQFKDAMLVVHGLVYAVLGSLIAVPDLGSNGRIGVVAFTVMLDMIFLFAARRDVERTAAEMDADYAADYRALTGEDPPRRLYSRALKMRQDRAKRKGGTTLLPGRADDDDCDEA